MIEQKVIKYTDCGEYSLCDSINYELKQGWLIYSMCSLSSTHSSLVNKLLVVVYQRTGSTVSKGHLSNEY
jgi:hypothetical protein